MKKNRDPIPDFEDFETRKKAFEALKQKIEAGDLDAVKFYLEKSTPPREKRFRVGLDPVVWQFLEVFFKKIFRPFRGSGENPRP